MSFSSCANIVSFGNWRPPIPRIRKSLSVSTKILAISNDEAFKWASSEADGNGLEAKLSLTPNFILPVEKRPNLAEVSKLNHTIPVIDMGKGDVDNIIKEMVKASEEYGFFLIVNHRVPQELCQNMLSAVIEFFHLSPQEKSHLVSNDSSKEIRISNHYRKVDSKDGNNASKFSMWSEVFKHPWHPKDYSFANMLPSNPSNYRKVVTEYAKEIGILMGQLFGLLSQGLGMNKDYLQNRLGKDPLCRVQANYYPPCPNPDLTLGLGVHTDRDALTVVLPTPNVEGLQIMKDGKWIMVDPVSNALIVNIGDQLEILSNGKYKSVLHRVITNESRRRVSLAMFYGPDKDALIGPIKDLIDDDHPRLYHDYYFREFLEMYRKQEGKNRKIKEFFQI